MQTWDDLRGVQRTSTLLRSLRKLTDEQARTMRACYASDQRATVTGLAAEYGVSRSTVEEILAYRTYRDEPRQFIQIQRHLRPVAPMPCALTTRDRDRLSNFPTATELSNTAHMAEWWAADARIQAANDAWDALDSAAD